MGLFSSSKTELFLLEKVKRVSEDLIIPDTRSLLGQFNVELLFLHDFLRSNLEFISQFIEVLLKSSHFFLFFVLF